MTFEKDLEFYKENKQKFMQEYPNMFILIKDKNVHGSFSNFQDAHKRALELFGVEDVLIIQMVEQQPLNFLASVA
ncbi:MAG: hypothetical protein M1301_03385 [Candidatus Thermoplasmatota archaeon]|jgi:hypothetical protein|nr:hypothetical protein [Candidatus Thermoplasmatota archaeon]